jgi:hypothetical protein
VRLLPTSSLDRFSPPEPFVNAMDWHQFTRNAPSSERLQGDNPIALNANDVDSCFESSDSFFLAEDYVVSHRDDQEWDMDHYDLELGLLEIVQEISISLARTPARRTAIEQLPSRPAPIDREQATGTVSTSVTR